MAGSFVMIDCRGEENTHDYDLAGGFKTAAA
jgi:hypothetical protein